MWPGGFFFAATLIAHLLGPCRTSQVAGFVVAVVVDAVDVELGAGARPDIGKEPLEGFTPLRANCRDRRTLRNAGRVA
jgi:hypothetical protein